VGGAAAAVARGVERARELALRHPDVAPHGTLRADAGVVSDVHFIKLWVGLEGCPPERIVILSLLRIVSI